MNKPPPDELPVARPIGALVLFLILFGVAIGMLLIPIGGTTCPGPLRAWPDEWAADECGGYFDARLTWFQVVAIPTIVAGCATVSRWPKFRRGADGSYIE